MMQCWLMSQCGALRMAHSPRRQMSQQTSTAMLRNMILRSSRKHERRGRRQSRKSIQRAGRMNRSTRRQHTSTDNESPPRVVSCFRAPHTLHLIAIQTRGRCNSKRYFQLFSLSNNQQCNRLQQQPRPPPSLAGPILRNTQQLLVSYSASSVERKKIERADVRDAPRQAKGGGDEGGPGGKGGESLRRREWCSV